MWLFGIELAYPDGAWTPWTLNSGHILQHPGPCRKTTAMTGMKGRIQSLFNPILKLNIHCLLWVVLEGLGDVLFFQMLAGSGSWGSRASAAGPAVAAGSIGFMRRACSINTPQSQAWAAYLNSHLVNNPAGLRNYRMACVVRDIKDHLVQCKMFQVTPSFRPGSSEPHPAWSWTHPLVGGPAPLWYYKIFSVFS